MKKSSMKKHAATRTALLTLVVTALLIALVGSASGNDGRTLTGEYKWNQGPQGPLEAKFTPNGEGKWKVDFHFTFRGQAHVYSGDAEGSLTEGTLAGRVLNEGKSRTFSFNGKFEEGKFRGTHAEIEGGEKFKTGTLTLGN